MRTRKKTENGQFLHMVTQILRKRFVSIPLIRLTADVATTLSVLFLVIFLIYLEAVARRYSIKKRLWHRCFPVNFAKFLITSFSTEHLWMAASENCYISQNNSELGA